MDFKVKGTIKVISKIQEFESGAKKLTFRIDTGEQYNNLLEFELFKGADYVEHLNKFLEYNKTGDLVEVEFKLKSNHWTKDGADKVFTSLTCWRVDKVNGESSSVTEGLELEPNDNGNDLPF